jgi:hypothetical protein
MTEALCHGSALEQDARVEQAPEIFEFVPEAVRVALDKALEGMIADIRGLGPDSCLRQAIEESDLRLSLDGWTFRIRARENAIQVVAAAPR